jgi:hypothetical protein
MTQTFARRTFNIGLVIALVRAAVADIHSGKLPAPPMPGQRSHLYRYTPCFISGARPTETGSRAYTAASIAKVLGMTRTNGRGNVKASIPVEVALNLLELNALGNISDSSLDVLCDGDYSLKDLLRKFPRKSLRDARAARC